jgi:hypothetical protein
MLRHSIRSIFKQQRQVRLFSVSHQVYTSNEDHPKSSIELHLNNDKDTVGTMEKENKNIELGAHPGELEHIAEEVKMGTSEIHGNNKEGLNRGANESAEDPTTGPLHQSTKQGPNFSDKDTIIDFTG